MTITKVWEDENDRDGVRPESITVSLLANGAPALDEKGNELTYELSEENGWAAMALGVPKYADGEEIEYTWSEDEDALAELGYTLESSETRGKITTLTNTYAPELTEVTVTKVWDDADDQDGLRPDLAEITVILYADGIPCAQATFEGEYTFTDLPKFEGGKEIVYTWTEDTTDLASYGYNMNGVEISEDGLETTITNTYQPDKYCLSILKVWNDKNDQDGVRPESITVTLLANGEQAGVKVLSAINEWKESWNDLPVKKEGKAIEYTVEETVVPEGYTAAVTGDAKTGFTITNTHEAKPTGEISIPKVGSNDTTKALEGAYLQITDPDGNKIKTWKTEAEAKTITGLSFDVEYTITEIAASDGYSVIDPITFTLKEDGTIETTAKAEVVKIDGTSMVITDKVKEPTPTPTTKPSGGGSSYSGGGSSSGGSVSHGPGYATPAANAKTGDDSPITLYVLLGLAAAAVILEEIIRRRRRSGEGNGNFKSQSR